MTVKLAVILWVIALAASKILQVYLFPKYKKTWDKWNRLRDPAGLSMFRNHPFHTVGWYVFVGVLFVVLLNFAKAGYE